MHTAFSEKSSQALRGCSAHQRSRLKPVQVEQLRASKSGHRRPRNCKHNESSCLSTKSRVRDEEDALVWDSASDNAREVSGGRRGSNQSSEEDKAGSDVWAEPEGVAEAPEAGTRWNKDFSEVEQAEMDREAQELAYSFGLNEARDVLDSQSGASQAAEGEEEDPQTANPAGNVKAGKGRRRIDRHSSRVKDTSIPLHMLPKVLKSARLTRRRIFWQRFEKRYAYLISSLP